jgi:hypothetical protein
MLMMNCVLYGLYGSETNTRGADETQTHYCRNLRGEPR